MAIAFESVAAGAGDWSTTLTLALNCGTGSNRFLVVLARTDRGGATTINSATYNGVAMTADTSFTSSITSYDFRLFYLIAPATGSNNVVVTFSDGNTRMGAIAICYTGVDQATGIENLTLMNGNSTTPSATVTSATNDLVVALFHAAATGGSYFTVGTDTVERNDTDVSNFAAIACEEPGGASITIGGTGSPTTEWFGRAFNLKVSGSGGGGSAKHNLLMIGVGG